jgi:hypothetical protein
MSMYKCPKCGSTEYQIQFEGAVWFTMKDEVLIEVGHGGVLGGDPRALQCLECFEEWTDFDQGWWDPLFAAVDATGYSITDDGFMGYEHGRSDVYERKNST